MNIKNKVLVGLLGTVLTFILALITFNYYPNLSTIFISIILGRIIISIIFKKQVCDFLKIKIRFYDDLIIFFIITITYLISNYFFYENIYLNLGLFFLVFTYVFKYLNGKELLNILMKRK